MGVYLCTLILCRCAKKTSNISCLPSCLGKSWPNSHLGGGSIFSAACGWELAGGAISSFCQGLEERRGEKSAGLLFLISAILAKRDGFHRKKVGGKAEVENGGETLEEAGKTLKKTLSMAK